MSTDAPRLTLASVLPPDVEEGFRTVKVWQAETRNRWRRFFNVPVTTFADPTEVERDYPSLRSACRQGVIAIALASGLTKAQIKVALLNRQDDSSRKILALMCELGIPAWHGDLRDAEAIRAFLDKTFTISPMSPPLAKRRPTNPAERWLLGELHFTLGLRLSPAVRDKLNTHPALLEYVESESRQLARRYRVYHEMSVGKLLTVAHASGSGDSMTEELKRLCAFGCDAVIATAPPRSRPLIVVEYDGRRHREPSQESKDAYRDGHLTRAGLAVVRISSATEGVQGGDWSEEAVTRINIARGRRCLQNYLWFVVNQLIEHFERVAARTERLDGEYARFHFALEQECRRAAVRHGRILTHDEKRAIAKTLSMDDVPGAESRFDELCDEALELHEAQAHRGRLLEGQLFAGKIDLGPTLSEITVMKHDDGSVSASATVTSACDEARRRISTPRFYVTLRLPDHTALSDISTEALCCDAARFALVSIT